MKNYILLALTLMLSSWFSHAQKGFGVDGTLGLGYNGGDLVYPLLMEGRVQWNDYLSTNLGVGIWNSGLKESWTTENLVASTAIISRLSNNETLPSLQLSTRGQIPVFKINNRTIRFFVEPKLYFLPFSARTVTLQDIYYNRKIDAISGKVSYEETGITVKNSLKSACNPRMYVGIQSGLIVEVFNNIDFALSYGLTNLDLFRDLRNRTIRDLPLNPYLPKKEMQLVGISLIAHMNL